MVVGICEGDAELSRELARHAPRIAIQTLHTEADIEAVDIVVARRGGDRWGLLVPAALAQGCRAVVSQPLDAAVAAMHGVHLVDEPNVLDTVLALIEAPENLRADAPAIALGAGRRIGALLATQRAAQLARAAVHGTPSSALGEVRPELATRLRRARVEALR